MRRMGSPLVSSLCSGGCTPWWKPNGPLITVSPRSGEGLRALHPLVDILFLGVERRAGVDGGHGALLGGEHELLEGPRLPVLDGRLLLRVVGEHLLVEVHALVARRAALGVDGGLDGERL